MTHAIPAQPFRAKPNSATALKYASAEAIRTVLADTEGQLMIERNALAWALKNGRSDFAAKTRSWIDYAETVRRNGRARLAVMGVG